MILISMLSLVSWGVTAAAIFLIAFFVMLAGFNNSWNWSAIWDFFKQPIRRSGAAIIVSLAGYALIVFDFPTSMFTTTGNGEGGGFLFLTGLFVLTPVGGGLSIWSIGSSFQKFSEITFKQSFKRRLLGIVKVTVGVALAAGAIAAAVLLLRPPEYTDNGNGTITANRTGLMWEKCSRGQEASGECAGTATRCVLADAAKYCSELALGDKSDWRLPEKDEIESIVDMGETRGKYTIINKTYFPGTESGWYWTSTKGTSEPGTAWIWNFSGNDRHPSYPGTIACVRCVRSLGK